MLGFCGSGRVQGAACAYLERQPEVVGFFNGALRYERPGDAWLKRAVGLKEDAEARDPGFMERKWEIRKGSSQFPK